MTLALGMGGSIAIFTIVNAVYVRQLPYPEAGHIYVMRSTIPRGTPDGVITPRDLATFMETTDHPVVQAAALVFSQPSNVVGADGRPNATLRYAVTEQFFEVFSSPMALGRGFVRGQTQQGSIVIAYPIWRDLLGADPDIIGKTVRIEGGQGLVVGVTPADFDFPEKPGFWMMMARLPPIYDDVRAYLGFVRVRTGRSQEQLQQQFDARAAELKFDAMTKQPLKLVAEPFLTSVVGDLGPTVALLSGAAGVLLLVALINAANLLLSRVTHRAREMAVREALGASRWRVARQLLTESLFLTTLAGAVGLAVAAAGVRLLLRIAPPDLPRLDHVPLDATVLFFTLLVIVLTGVVVGLVPVVRLIRQPLRALLNDEGRSMSSGRAQKRLFGSLVVAEISLAVLLVIGAGLLMRSYANLRAAGPGFNPERLVTFTITVPGRLGRSPVTRDGRQAFQPTYLPVARFLDDLTERLGGVSGVQAVATANGLPLSPKHLDDPGAAFHFPGRAGNADGTAMVAKSRSVSHDFFSTMQVRLLAGRGFEPSDRHDSPGVAVVNETFVKRHFPNESPLQQRIRYDLNLWAPGQVGFQISHRLVDELEIVGVVADVKYLDMAAPAESAIYVSSEQWINRRVAVIVRAGMDDPAGLIGPIRDEIRQVDPAIATEVHLYDDLVRSALARHRLGMMLLVIFGVVAVALATVGIYAVMSYSVTARTGEIAIRSALGATSQQLVHLFLRHGVLLAVGGIGIGLAGAIALRRLVASQLYGVSALDWGVFVFAPLAVLGVAALASFVPARRAVSTEPADLLRMQ